MKPKKKVVRKRKQIAKRSVRKRVGAVKARGLFGAVSFSKGGGAWSPSPPPPPPPPPQPLSAPVVALSFEAEGPGNAVAAAVWEVTGENLGQGAILETAWVFHDPVMGAGLVVSGAMVSGAANTMEPGEREGTETSRVFAQLLPWVGSVQLQAWDGAIVHFSARWKTNNGVENMWSEPQIRIVEP